ncbi:MAG: hypothetical protein WD534_00635 [Phycisphaeraceae bacterium]
MKHAISRALLVVCLAVLLATMAAFLWTAGLHEPASHARVGIALRLPASLSQVVVQDDGLHLLHQRPSFGQRSTGFEPAGNFGRGGYGHGVIVSGLGFTFAWLPQGFQGSDYVESPYMAIVLPYWLLIAGSALGFLYLSGLARRLVGLCRFTRTSWALMALGSVGFLVLNGLPSAELPGGRTHPKTISQWYMRTFEPSTHSRITHRFGYPFTWFQHRRAPSRPHDVDWRQHRMMDNLLLGASVILMLGMAPEAGRRLIDPPKPPMACRRCGYDLRGNHSEFCPECGHQLSVTQKDQLNDKP